MKIAIVFLVLVAVAIAAEAKPQFTTKYDNIDLDQILRSDRLLNNYVNCLLGEGNCTPEGKELKKALPDALATGCKSCSDKQRGGSEKVIRFLVNERPQLWTKLAAKYDPNNEYRHKYVDQAKASGIDIPK